MIKFKDLLERTKTERIAIHTPTEEQAITLLKALDKKGYTWNSGDKCANIRYKMFSESTCYTFYDYYGKLLDKKIMYSPLDWYQENSYTIIEFSEIEFKENK